MTADPLRICFVASEILGAHKNGGIGTATTHAALFLAGAGHSVSIVYTGASPIDHKNVWMRRCAAAGIVVTPIATGIVELYPVWLRESSVVFDVLRAEALDVILFQDWGGMAFSSVVAKKAGLAFAGTTLAVIAHGPTAWLLDANRTLARDQTTLAHLHMERVAFEEADAVLCPSRHMLEWLRLQDLRPAGQAAAVPLYLWSDPGERDLDRSGGTLDRVTMLTFFGRLETRKGVELFLDAILSDRLASRAFKVAFVGKPASFSPAQIADIIAQRRPELLSRVSFESDLDTDQAQAFLTETKSLAVIPSLIDNAPCVISECLRRRIPFLSTMTGGIPELIAGTDVARILVEPTADALARRFADVLDQRFEPAAPAYRERDVAARWEAWLAALPYEHPCPATSTGRASDHDRIALVVTHYERPALLAQTLESLAAQTRTDFEVVLVDDGSASPEAQARLDLTERRIWPFSLTLLREPNRYLGAARNAGIRATAAERLIFMDDDNIAFPDMVETLDAALSRTGSDIVTCQMSIFRHAADAPDPADLYAAERWGFTGGSVELGLSVNCFGDATGIYRRSVFDRVGFFHENRGVGFEDWHLHARAALAGLSTTSLPVPLYWYRRVATGMLMKTDTYQNNKLIWNAYRSVLPDALRRLVDLSVRNDAMFGPR